MEVVGTLLLAVGAAHVQGYVFLLDVAAKYQVIPSLIYTNNDDTQYGLFSLKLRPITKNERGRKPFANVKI